MPETKRSHDSIYWRQDHYEPEGARPGTRLIDLGGRPGLHPEPMTLPISCGDSLAGCHTPPEQMQKLLEAGR